MTPVPCGVPNTRCDIANFGALSRDSGLNDDEADEPGADPVTWYDRETSCF